MFLDSDLIIEQALKRVQLTLNIREKLYDRLKSNKLKSFKKQLRISSEIAKSNIEKNLKHLLDLTIQNDINTYIVDNLNDAANIIHVNCKEEYAIRSSSRVLNCIETFNKEKVPKLIQTDLYDFYFQQCIAKKIKLYPRHQTIVQDYWNVEPWSSYKGKSSNGITPLNILVEHIKKYNRKIDTAICGANAITANGEIVVVENIGNIRSLLGKKHVIFTVSEERICNSISDAFLRLQIPKMHNLSSKISSMVHIISSPNFTDTLKENNTPYGINKLILIIIRNMTSDKYPHCIGCGLCSLVCPAYELYGIKYSWNGYSASRGILKAWKLKQEEIFKAGVYLCEECGKCSEVCPVNHKPSDQISKIKSYLKNNTDYKIYRTKAKEISEKYKSLAYPTK